MEYIGVVVCSACTHVALYPGKAELVVGLALLIISKHLVGLGSFLELLLGLGVSGIPVGMVFDSQLSVSFLNVFFGGRFLYPQNLIVISLGCHYFLSSSTTSKSTSSTVPLFGPPCAPAPGFGPA